LDAREGKKQKEKERRSFKAFAALS